MKVLDKGSVELIDHMGSDLSVVNAARVSFSKESEWDYEARSAEEWGTVIDKRLSSRDTKLINYLARENHWTPFGQANVKFRIKMPIFVARQAMRSNVGIVWNEESRRYIDSEPEFYEPDVWRGRPKGSIKQGSGETCFPSLTDYYRGPVYSVYGPVSTCIGEYEDVALDQYQKLLDFGVAPEMARMILPQSTYTTVVANFTLAAAARFCGLRSDSHAQLEIQEYSNAMSELIEPLFPVSWVALRG